MLETLKFHFYDSLLSTQEQAKKLSLETDKLHVIIAFEQTGGRGTFGKQWMSPKNCGLYATFAYKIPNHFQTSSLSHLSATAACMAIENVHPQIKWPNDILIDGKKIGGVITEIHDSCIYAGIGLNIIKSKSVANVEDQATTSYDQYAKPPSIQDLAHVLADHYLKLVQLWEKGGFEKIKPIYNRYFNLVNKNVIINTPGGLIKGFLLDFTPQGYPILQMRLEKHIVSHVQHITLEESP
jgi:BirA family biotin operon repressor/biotin-[acetyl-CoA-carboxylase] ligase